MTTLLAKAFTALDPGSTPREFGLVADALIASEDEETLAILDEAARRGEAFNTLGKQQNGFVVLDLVTAVAARQREARSR